MLEAYLNETDKLRVMEMIKTFDTILGKKEIEFIEHAEFGEIPKTIYKYRDWSKPNHQNMLKKSEIYYASPAEFNDPFDCGIDISYELLKDDPELCRNYFTQFVTTSKRSKDFSKEQQANEINRLIEEGRYKDQLYLNEKAKEHREDLFRVFGVFCTSLVPNNILMWAHYSNSHKGFCIGLDTSKVLAILRGRASLVHYADNYPIISPMLNKIEQMFQQTALKANFWNYEIEYRIAKFNSASQAVSISKDCITEIIFGAGIPFEDRQEMEEFVKSDLHHVKMFQAIPKKRSFELDLVSVN